MEPVLNESNNIIINNKINYIKILLQIIYFLLINVYSRNGGMKEDYAQRGGGQGQFSDRNQG